MLLLDTTMRAATNFADLSAWTWLLQFFLIAGALLLANVLRTKVKFLQRSLVPTALIAGLLILLCKLFPAFNQSVDKQVMELLTYHCLGLGFVALALKNNKLQSRSKGITVTETGCVTASTYLLQAVIGLLVTIPLFLWWNRDSFFYSSGILLAMGYGQGPGQALNIGNIYTQQAAEQGFAFAGTDFGLSIAAMGFLLGSVAGVVYMNLLRRKHKLQQADAKHEDRYCLQDYEDSNEIPHAESIDKLTVQLGLVFFVYALVFLVMWGIQQADLGNLGSTLKPLCWGFNFLWGTILGVTIKSCINLFKRTKLMRREYINNFMLDRIAGLCFDVMIVAGTAATDFNNLRNIWLPLLLVCLLGLAGTFWYLRRVCDHLYPTYRHESFLSLFGTLTGTANNGMILLREIDPKFETPAANNLVLQTIPAIIFGAPVLFLVGFAPLSLRNCWLALAIMTGIFLLFNLFIFRKRLFKKRTSTP